VEAGSTRCRELSTIIACPRYSRVDDGDDGNRRLDESCANLNTTTSGGLESTCTGIRHAPFEFTLDLLLYHAMMDVDNVRTNVCKIIFRCTSVSLIFTIFRARNRLIESFCRIIVIIFIGIIDFIL